MYAAFLVGGWGGGGVVMLEGCIEGRLDGGGTGGDGVEYIARTPLFISKRP